MKFSLEPAYSKRGKRYVKASEVFRMNGQWGDVQSKAVYTYAQVDGVLLPSKVVEVSTWNGKPAGERKARAGSLSCVVGPVCGA